MEICPPKTLDGYPDRGLDCEMNLEPAFQMIAEQAEAAGWTGDEVEMALLGLARARIEMRRCNAATDWAISQLSQA